MEFQRARSKEQFEQREADIINSAMALYEQFGFEEVTFSKISETTKFTRPTIYSYFKTKEEIMLRLTAIYLEKFILCFENKFSDSHKKDTEFVATAFTQSFIEVGEFIHLYTVLYSLIEKNVSVEALAQFKREVMGLQAVLANILKSIYTKANDDQIYNFLIFCLSFASGICPMSEQSELQKKAIELSATGYVTPNFEIFFKDTLIIYLEKLEF